MFLLHQNSFLKQFNNRWTSFSLPLPLFLFFFLFRWLRNSCSIVLSAHFTFQRQIRTENRGFFRSKTGSTAECDGTWGIQWFSNIMARATWAHLTHSTLYDQISYGCPMEDTQSWPNTSHWFVVFGKKSGRRTNILFPCAGPFAKQLRIKWWS